MNIEHLTKIKNTDNSILIFNKNFSRRGLKNGNVLIPVYKNTKETEKAFCFDLKGYQLKGKSATFNFWVPKTQLKEYTTINNIVYICVPSWLARGYDITLFDYRLGANALRAAKGKKCISELALTDQLILNNYGNKYE